MKTAILILAMAIAAVGLAQSPSGDLALNNVVNSKDAGIVLEQSTI